MLTFKLQREVATNTNATISTTRHDVVNAHAISSNVQNDVANTRTTVSDIHRNGLISPKDIYGQEQVVSTIPTLPITGSRPNTA